MYERKGSPYNSNMTSSGLEIQKKNEIQTHSVISFSKNPNALKSVMNASFHGKRGPLVPLISGQKPQNDFKQRSSYSNSHAESDERFFDEYTRKCTRKCECSCCRKAFLEELTKCYGQYYAKFEYLLKYNTK